MLGSGEVCCVGAESSIKYHIAVTDYREIIEMIDVWIDENKVSRVERYHSRGHLPQ